MASTSAPLVGSHSVGGYGAVDVTEAIKAAEKAEKIHYASLRDSLKRPETYATMLETALSSMGDVLVAIGSDLPVVQYIFAAGKQIHEHVKRMKEMDEYCGKVTVRVAVLLCLLGQENVRKAILEDDSCTVLLGTVYTYIAEARHAIDTYMSQWRLCRCCGAESSLVALQDINADLLASFTLLHQFVTIRRATITDDCSAGDQVGGVATERTTNRIVSRVANAVAAEGATKVATIAVTPDAVTKLHTKLKNTASEVETTILDALAQQTKDLQSSIDSTALRTEQRIVDALSLEFQGEAARQNLANARTLKAIEKMVASVRQEAAATGAATPAADIQGPPVEAIPREAFAGFNPVARRTAGQKFQDLVDHLLKNKRVSSAAISRVLGYSGKNGPRDLQRVRDGGGKEYSAADAYDELMKLSHA